MTGNDVVEVLDEWINQYRRDWYSSPRSMYESNEIVCRLTELQRMLHEVLDKEIKYRIEYLCTYYDAVYLYKSGGVDGWIDSMNYDSWEYNDKDVFDTEEDARKVWNEEYTKSFIWDPEEFGADPNEPEVGISMYRLIKYKNDDDETILEQSSTIVTPEDIQKMYPDFDFENAEF